MERTVSDSPEKTDSAAAETAVGHPDRYDLQIFQQLRKIIRGIDIHSRNLRTAYNLTTPQLVCLLTIVQNGPLTSKDISKRIFLGPSTVVGVLVRLEGKGLISRKRDTDDRRLVYSSATREGIDMAANAPSPLQEGLAAALNSLPDKEKATIAHSLGRIVDLMEVRHVDAAPILETGSLDRDDSGDGSTD